MASLPNLKVPLPVIPDQIISFDGQVVDTSQPVWRIRSAIDGGKMMVFNWSRMNQIKLAGQALYSQRALHLMKLYVSDCLSRRKATTAGVYFSSFIKFGQWLVNQAEQAGKLIEPGGFDWSQYDEALARTWLEWGIQHTASKGDYFRHLRIFYQWGLARQYPDFKLETARTLQTIKPALHPVGHHVRFRHQTKGPFSAAEKRLIIQAIQTEAGQLSDQVLAMLHLELGLNPKAAARLLNRDFKRVVTNSAIFYQLDVPRIKKRSAVRETRRRPISERLGQALVQLQQGGPDAHLLHWLNPANPESSINQALQRWAEAAQLVSPRTGKRLQLNPRRFRYTLASHLAEEGASKFHLAMVLDHTDLNYVDVYVETSSTIAEPVAAATDASLKPVINRFLGKVVDTLEEPAFPALPVNQLIPAAMPHIPLLNVAGIGVCGRNVSQKGLCQLFPPLSCYVCPSFAALRDGPHRDLLSAIETFMTGQAEQLDQRMVVQLDDVRQAIEQLLGQVETTAAEVSP